MSKLVFDFNNAVAGAVGAYGINKKELGEAGAMLGQRA